MGGASLVSIVYAPGCFCFHYLSPFIFILLQVVRCKTRNIRDASNINLVAVKYLKPNASSEMESTFLKEVEILSNFDHPNVIPLVGVCLDPEGPMCLVLGKPRFADAVHID